MSVSPEPIKTQEGLYDMKVAVLIQPVGIIKNMEHVELRIDGELIGKYPTYTQACEQVMHIVNQH
jgi:hypothetical protein|tara:strand:+ start:3677 stop:3871 length:195 start_codon:yes stop_codon:yes gene_type:complete